MQKNPDASLTVEFIQQMQLKKERQKTIETTV